MIKRIAKAIIATVVDVTVAAGVLATRLIPVTLWLRIKNEAQIVSQADYRYPIRMVVDSSIESNLRLRESTKEPETVTWIEEWFESGDVLYDIGANVGSYSLITYACHGSAIRTFAFEPGFVTFPQLCRNVHLNHAAGSIVPFQVALSDTTSVMPFHYQNLSTGGALHALGDAVDQWGESFEPVCTIPTLTYRLDDFVDHFDLPTPHHIKIDVDGTELQILRGGSHVLASPSLRTVLIEAVDAETAGEIAAILASHRLQPRHQYGAETLYAKEGAEPAAGAPCGN